MATRVEEAARGTGGGTEEAVEGERDERPRSPRQKVSGGDALVGVGSREWLGYLFRVYLFTYPPLPLAAGRTSGPFPLEGWR